MSAHSQPKGAVSLEERLTYLRKSRDGHAAMAHAEFEKRVMVSDVLISMIERFGRLDGCSEDKALIDRAFRAYSSLTKTEQPKGAGQSSGEADGWRSMETAPTGSVTEDVGCRGDSEWFLGRVSQKYRAGRPPYIVIKRRAWPNEDSWVSAGDTYYVPDFFDAWSLLYAAPTDNADGLSADREREITEALKWYGEQARLARLIHSEGDAGRHALSADGGKRALAALKDRA